MTLINQQITESVLTGNVETYIELSAIYFKRLTGMFSYQLYMSTDNQVILTDLLKYNKKFIVNQLWSDKNYTKLSTILNIGLLLKHYPNDLQELEIFYNLGLQLSIPAADHYIGCKNYPMIIYLFNHPELKYINELVTKYVSRYLSVFMKMDMGTEINIRDIIYDRLKKTQWYYEERNYPIEYNRLVEWVYSIPNYYQMTSYLGQTKQFYTLVTILKIRPINVDHNDDYIEATINLLLNENVNLLKNVNIRMPKTRHSLVIHRHNLRYLKSDVAPSDITPIYLADVLDWDTIIYLHEKVNVYFYVDDYYRLYKRFGKKILTIIDPQDYEYLRDSQSRPIDDILKYPITESECNQIIQDLNLIIPNMLLWNQIIDGTITHEKYKWIKSHNTIIIEYHNTDGDNMFMTPSQNLLPNTQILWSGHILHSITSGRFERFYSSLDFMLNSFNIDISLITRFITKRKSSVYCNSNYIYDCNHAGCGAEYNIQKVVKRLARYQCRRENLRRICMEYIVRNNVPYAGKLPIVVIRMLNAI